MDGIANHFPDKIHKIARFCIYNLKLFQGVISPDLRRSVPGAWTQTPISACLASVPIVPVARNDHCGKWTNITRFWYKPAVFRKRVIMGRFLIRFYRLKPISLQ